MSIYVTVFGFVLAFFGQSAPMDWAFNDMVDAMFWSGTPSPETMRYQAWVYGVLGGCMIGWGVCLIFLTWYPFANRESWAWSCIAVAMTIWFVVDTSLSLYHGAAFNAGFNLLFYLLFAVPLAFTHRYFFQWASLT